MTATLTESPALPERIAGLATLARNLSWSWNHEARALYRSIDPTLWGLTRHNPFALLRRVDAARLNACAADPEFLRQYDALMERAAREASNAGTWFATTYPHLTGRTVAYFCAEFGLHNSVPIYSGGLGILAGDQCKAASDLGVPLVGVGLLYTRGYFDQRLRLDGWQEDADERFDVSLTPLERVLGPGGAHDLRMRQEWILGVGGVRVLRALGLQPATWHANEGHAAFMLLERVRELVAQATPFDEAVRRVRATSIFTTHTPVPAGHDAFSLEQVVASTGPIWEEMGVSRDAVLRLGHHPVRDHGQFHMPVLAIRLSQQVNGVARRHGEESRRMWAGLWPGRDPARVPIGHVTNGVHLATWMSHRMTDLLNAHLGPDWPDRVDEPGFWDSVLGLENAAVWQTHRELKGTLLRAIRDDARRRWADQWKEALHLVGAGTLLEERALTIGFARRFATYKRASLIFRDLDRLQRLLANPWRPVQLVFSGKAHPADEPGKQMLKSVYALTREARFEGRIAFLEDYEMHLAHNLVQGVDLWLNVPRPPLEASGTSGMKAGLNGVPQLGTLDGWWAEGYDGRNGWAIPAAPDGADAAADAADAEQLYRLLEQEVVPLFYDRDARDVPLGWVDKMKHALRVAGRHFTAQRMVRQYVTEYYVPAITGQLPGDDPPAA